MFNSDYGNDIVLPNYVLDDSVINSWSCICGLTSSGATIERGRQELARAPDRSIK